MRGKKSRSLLALLRPPFLGQIIFKVTFLYKAKSNVPPVPQSNVQVPLRHRTRVTQLFWHEAYGQTRTRLSPCKELPLYFPIPLNTSRITKKSDSKRKGAQQRWP